MWFWSAEWNHMNIVSSALLSDSSASATVTYHKPHIQAGDLLAHAFSLCIFLWLFHYACMTEMEQVKPHFTEFYFRAANWIQMSHWLWLICHSLPPLLHLSETRVKCSETQAWDKACSDFQYLTKLWYQLQQWSQLTGTLTCLGTEHFQTGFWQPGHKLPFSEGTSTVLLRSISRYSSMRNCLWMEREKSLLYWLNRI